MAWAEAQDGIASPADFNNGTNSKGETTGLTFANTTITGPDASGYLTAKAVSAKAFPVGAKMRTVGLQGYWSQTSPAASRHTVSAVKTVTGDTPRRRIFSSAKCAKCHEFFEGHGGSRVFSKDTPDTETSVCVMCHNPRKATSGRGITDAAWDTYAAGGRFSASDLKKLSEWGVSTTAVNRALALPVTSNNMKDMIHGIHAGRERVTPFIDARDRLTSAITLLDFRRMDFPGILNQCETCHLSGTYSGVPLGAMASNYESINAADAAAILAGTRTPALAKASYAIANPEDKVTSPFAAACVSCHDSPGAQGHIATQGGMLQINRGTTTTAGTWAYNVNTPGKGEACVTCHGTGKAEDVAVVHAK